MPDLDYTWQKLSNAVSEFAKHGTLQCRLGAAFSKYSQLGDDDFSDRTQKEIFLAIQERMTSNRKRKGYYVQDTLAEMDDDEAQANTDMLMELAGRVESARYFAAKYSNK